MLMLQEGPPSWDNSDRGWAGFSGTQSVCGTSAAIKGTGMDTQKSSSTQVMSICPFCVLPSVPVWQEMVSSNQGQRGPWMLTLLLSAAPPNPHALVFPHGHHLCMEALPNPFVSEIQNRDSNTVRPSWNCGRKCQDHKNTYVNVVLDKLLFHPSRAQQYNLMGYIYCSQQSWRKVEGFEKAESLLNALCCIMSFFW